MNIDKQSTRSKILYPVLSVLFALSACAQTTATAGAPAQETTNQPGELESKPTDVDDTIDNKNDAGADETAGDQTGADCPFPMPEGEIIGETIECGTIPVPENWDNPVGREITISYAILKTPNKSPFHDPVIYLEGGPGSSALAGLPFLADTFAELRRYRDVVIYDQRGTSYSSALDCPSEIANQPVDVPDISNNPPVNIDSSYEEMEKSAKTLGKYKTAVNCAPYFKEQGVDLSMYSTANSVLDLIALMEELAYEEYNIYGISYGTNVALELFRTYEESDGASLPTIRSGVIDGNVPPNVDTRSGQAFNIPNNILRVFADCGADTACDAAFPDIRQRAINLLLQLNESALQIGEETITFKDLRKVMGAALNFKLNEKGDLVVGIGATYLPLMVEELENNEIETYLGLRDGSLPPELEKKSIQPDNPLTALSTESTDLVAQARLLADNIEGLSLRSKRTEDVLYSGKPLPEFFMSEMRTDVAKMDALTSMLFPVLANSVLANPSERDALLGIATNLDTDLAILVPLMSDRDVTATLDLLKEALPSLRADDPITYTIITCNDRYASLNPERMFAGFRAYEVPEMLIKIDVGTNEKVACEAWGLTPDDTDLKPAVVSSLPILVSNGSTDPETPVEWGESAAIGLENAYFVTYAFTQHGASAQFECGPAVTAAFFMDPMRMPDVTCSESVRQRFPFVLPE